MKDPGNSLDRFLKDASPEQMASDPVLQQAFTVALLASDLYLPVEGTADNQKKAGGVSLMAVPIDDHPHVMIFSSEARLKAFLPTGTRFARASGNSVLPSLNGHYAILNPGPEGRIMAPEDIARITRQPPDQLSDCSAPGHVHGPDCRH